MVRHISSYIAFINEKSPSSFVFRSCLCVCLLKMFLEVPALSLPRPVQLDKDMATLFIFLSISQYR